MWLGCLPYFHFIIAVSWDGAREEEYCARVSGCRPKKMPSRLPCCTFRTSPLPAVGLLIRKLASKQKDREGSPGQKVCSAFFSVDKVTVVVFSRHSDETHFTARLGMRRTTLPSSITASTIDFAATATGFNVVDQFYRHNFSLVPFGRSNCILLLCPISTDPGSPFPTIGLQARFFLRGAIG